MRPLRLIHKLILAMGAILLLLSLSFYYLTNTRIEDMTMDRVHLQLRETDVVFRNLRVAQARLLSIVIQSVAELPGVKSAGDMLMDQTVDSSEAATQMLEQTISAARAAESDILIVTDRQNEVVTRVIQHTGGSWTYERLYGASDLVSRADLALASGTVKIQVPSLDPDAGAPPQSFEVPAKHLLATDRYAALLAPEEQAKLDTGTGEPIPFLTQLGPEGKIESDPVTFWVFRDELYQVTFAPLVFPGYDGVVGTIILGYRIGDTWAREIAEASNSEISFVLEGKLIASSFPAVDGPRLMSVLPAALSRYESRLVQADRGRLPTIGFELDGEDHLAVAGVVPGTECRYVMSLSLTEALRPLRELQRELQGVLLAVLLVALVVSALVSNGIARPLRGLELAMESVMKGDYGTRVKVLTPREVAQLAVAFNEMVQGLSEREQYKKMVSRSASELVQRLATGSGESTSVSNRVEMTVLFSDIRSFTTLSEGMSPEAVVGMLNEYFEAMGRVIASNGGDIDKFIGDAIMAFFKSTTKRDGAENAVLCAVQMQRELAALNERRLREGKPDIQIGVGLNTGVVVEGHVGTQDRFEHTVLGDTVNVASRLEGECKKGKHLRIVISQSTYDRVRHLVDVESMGSTMLKGKTETLPIYEVKALTELGDVQHGLEDPSPQARVRAAERILGLASEDEAAPSVVPLLQDPTAEVRAGVARILAQHPNVPGTASHVVEALRRERDESVRAALVEAVGQLGGEGALEELERTLGNPVASTRMASVEALETIGGRAALRAIESALQDEEPQVRAAAAVALHRLGSGMGEKTLEEMLHSSGAAARRLAARRLGDVGEQLYDRWTLAERRLAGGQQSHHLERLVARVAGELEGALDDSDETVALEAIQSLIRMKHRPSLSKLAELASAPTTAAVGERAREAIGLIGG